VPQVEIPATTAPSSTSQTPRSRVGLGIFRTRCRVRMFNPRSACQSNGPRYKTTRGL